MDGFWFRDIGRVAAGGVVRIASVRLSVTR